MVKITLPTYDAAVSFPQSSASIVDTCHVDVFGYAFERHLELLVSALARKESSIASSPKRADAKQAKGDEDASRGSGSTRKAVKISAEDLMVDWYEVLNLPQEDSSHPDEIRTAYRKRCLETHPDKQPDKSDEMFKKVTRAFEILGDPDARRAFDSSRPFDDAIPGEDVKEEVFFTTFGPVFERNKKWSSLPHAPSLGDNNTSLKNINKFYDFWLQFRTWRDFSHEAELEDIDEGMCREEKRFYQRENERQLQGLRKAETKRMRTLAERAQKNDPRLRKIREEEAAKAAKEKKEREDEKKRILDEEINRRNIQAEKERKEAEEKRNSIIDSKMQAKRFQQGLTQYFIDNKLLDKVETNLLLQNAVRIPNIKWIFTKLSQPEGEALLQRVQACDPAIVDGVSQAVLAFNASVEATEMAIGVTRYGESIKKKIVELPKTPVAVAVKTPVVATPAAEWTDEDVSLLTKCIAKFPGGTVDRWRKIAVMMKEKFSEEDVLLKTKQMELWAQKEKSGDNSAMPTAAQIEEAAAADAATAVPVILNPEDWTAKQQAQLESQLRLLKDYKEKDKYQKIADGVEGKNARACFERYKFLCSLNNKGK